MPQSPFAVKPAPAGARPSGRLPALNWVHIFWWSAITVLGIILAPFTFTWSGLAVCAILYVLTGLGITLGYHRLLTHRSFRTPKAVEYTLTVLGVSAIRADPCAGSLSTASTTGTVTKTGIPIARRTVSGGPISFGGCLTSRLWMILAATGVTSWTWRRARAIASSNAIVLYCRSRWPDFSSGRDRLWGGVGLSWLVWGIFVRTAAPLPRHLAGE